jgi:hypothetical protein
LVKLVAAAPCSFAAVAAFSRRPSAHETPMKSVNKRGQKAKISPNAD